jgi:ABC-2 type transport system ATP-binding protein
VLSEMAQLADRVVIIHRGRLISHTSLSEILARAEGGVRVRTPQAEQFRSALSSAGIESAETSPGTLAIKDTPIERVGELAAQNQIVLHELSPESASLEEVFLELTGDAT